MKVAHMPWVTWDKQKKRAVYQRIFPKDVHPLLGKWYRHKYPSSMSKRQADEISHEQTMEYMLLTSGAQRWLADPANRDRLLGAHLQKLHASMRERAQTFMKEFAATSERVRRADEIAELQQAAAKLGIKVDLPEPEPKPPVDTEAVIQSWISRNKQEGNPPKERAITSKRNKMALFLATVGKPHMGEVVEADGKRYARHLEQKAGAENKPSLPNDHISALKTLFEVAYSRDYITVDPFANIKVPQRQRGKRPYFDDDEAGRILLAAHDSDPVVKWSNWLAAFTTCINSEVFEAKASEFYQLDDGQWVWDMRGRKLKTGFRPRMLPLHPSLIRERFLDYLATRKGKSLFDGNPASNSNRVNLWLKKHSTKSYYSWRHRTIHWLDSRVRVNGERFDPKLSEYASGHKAVGIHNSFYNHHEELVGKQEVEWHEIVAGIKALPDPTP